MVYAYQFDDWARSLKWLHRGAERGNRFSQTMIGAYYVIFDTGPVLSVADTSILIEQSDVNILIARHGTSRMNEIKQAIDNYSQINQSINGIVYNAYARPKNYYGYYGVYGNYSYKYYADKYLDDTYEYNK